MRRVLIVENEALVANELAMLVQSLGYHPVAMARSRSEAIAAAARTHPEVALVDLELDDGMTGRDVADRLEAEFGTRIVFLTGFPATLASRDRAGRMLAVKPFYDLAVADMLRRLDAALARDRL